VQMRRFTLVRSLALSVMLTLMVVQVLAFAQDASAQAKKLEGTWDTEFTNVDCQTGVPVAAPAQTLETYLPGGVMLQSTNRLLFRTPGYGIWKHTTERNFLATFTFFRFNADGTPAGRSEITEQIELGTDVNEFTATGVAEVFDVDGNLTQTVCLTATGQRFTFDK
jgi:hypothetical protein